MKSFHTRTAQFSFSEEKMLFIRLNENAEIDIPEVDENYQAAYELTQFEKHVVLVDATAHINITKEARERLGSPEYQKSIVAQAIVVNSLANRIIGNFMIRMNKALSTAKLFSDETSARKWLKKQWEADLLAEKGIREKARLK
jgi:hypothetical protein